MPQATNQSCWGHGLLPEVENYSFLTSDWRPVRSGDRVAVRPRLLQAVVPHPRVHDALLRRRLHPAHVLLQKDWLPQKAFGSGSLRHLLPGLNSESLLVNYYFPSVFLSVPFPLISFHIHHFSQLQIPLNGSSNNQWNSYRISFWHM